MPKQRLDKATCDAATYSGPAGSKTPIYIWDTEQPGLGLRIEPSGTKTWWVQYTVHRRRRFERIGRYKDKSLSEARSKAKSIGGQVADGRDPAAEKTEKTAAELARKEAESTLADAWAKFQDSRWPALADWTKRDYLNRWRAHLGPALGSKSLQKITGGDVQDLYDSLRQKPTTANHVLALISTIWSYAAGRNDMGVTLLSPNPTKVITKATRYRKNVRERSATSAELRDFLRGVDDAEADGRLSPHEAVGLLLVPFTLLRITDVVRLRWSWIDLDARTITIPAEWAKGARIARSDKPEVAVLAKPIVAKLRALERIDELVVASNLGGARYEMKDPYDVVRPAKDLGLYDFKTTSETMLREAGVAQGWIDAAARHRPQGVGQRHYALGTITQATKAIDKLADLLARVQGDVLPRKRKAAK